MKLAIDKVGFYKGPLQGFTNAHWRIVREVHWLPRSPSSNKDGGYSVDQQLKGNCVHAKSRRNRSTSAPFAGSQRKPIDSQFGFN